MLKRGNLNVPIIGVAGSGWNLDQLRAARDSVEKRGGVDPAAFDKLCGLLRYVDGDYKVPATFHSIRKELGPARRPAYYLAIPPTLFQLVVEQLAKSGCTKGAPGCSRKAICRDLASARDLNQILPHRRSTSGQSSASTIISESGRSRISSSFGSSIRFWSRSGTAIT